MSEKVPQNVEFQLTKWKRWGILGNSCDTGKVNISYH